MQTIVPVIVTVQYKLFAIVVVGTFLVAQPVKNPLTMRETSVRSLSWEDPLGESMATYSSILAWTIPWVEESGGLQFIGSQRVEHEKQFSKHTPKVINMCSSNLKIESNAQINEKIRDFQNNENSP